MFEVSYPSLSRRDVFALVALHALVGKLAHGHVDGKYMDAEHAEISVRYADSLIAALDEPSEATNDSM